MQQTTATRAPLPVSELCSSRVSLLSRNGMCTAEPSASLAMTAPSVSRDLLMYAPSLRRVRSDVTRADSLPARSIRFRCEMRRSLRVAVSHDSMLTWQSVCDRDESSFTCVADTVRCEPPAATSASASSTVRTCTPLRCLCLLPTMRAGYVQRRLSVAARTCRAPFCGHQPSVATTASHPAPISTLFLSHHLCLAVDGALQAASPRKGQGAMLGDKHAVVQVTLG